MPYCLFLQWVVGMLKVVGGVFLLAALIFDWFTLTPLTGEIPDAVVLTAWVTAFVALLPGVFIFAKRSLLNSLFTCARP